MATVPDASAATAAGAEEELDAHRPALLGHCYRMLGSPFEAEDAVQESMLRAWRGLSRFEERSDVSTWLYRIATNVCLDMLKGRQRRAVPMDFGPAQAPVAENLRTRPDATWVEPIPGALVAEADPADTVVASESIILAFIAALQQLPPRQRAVLILSEVLRWKASEVAELLETSVASVNSALQRARTTLQARGVRRDDVTPSTQVADPEMLRRYVDAFQRYDLEALTAVIHEDATMSMPPYDMWLASRDDIFAWFYGPGIGCRGSRVVPVGTANGSPAFGQYKPSPNAVFDPWALKVIEVRGGRIQRFTFFLNTARLFPLFGLPPRLEA
jgi:RNA polymerase sigma-70 factor (ECF subfamily)